MTGDRPAEEGRGAVAFGWGSVAGELTLLLAFSAALFAVARELAAPRADLHFLFLVVVGLHALATSRFCIRVADFLALECPSCSASYHGYPDSLPRPFRKGCAHCGATLH